MPPPNSRWPLIANALVFQGGWFACVLGGSGWASVVMPLILVGHGYWLARPGEWRWWLGFGVVGVVVDGGLMIAGGIAIEHSSPLWLWALWPLFATTLHHCLAWLWSHRALAAACGIIGGPMSYLSGAALADVTIQPWAVAVEALVWGTICVGVAWRLGGRRQPLPGGKDQE